MSNNESIFQRRLSVHVSRDSETSESAQPWSDARAAGELESEQDHFVEEKHLTRAIQKLRSGQSPRERAAAARALGRAKSELATTALVAALFDSESEVRLAAVESLTIINDPSINIDSITSLFGDCERQGDGKQHDDALRPRGNGDQDSDSRNKLLMIDPTLRGLPRELAVALGSADEQTRIRGLENLVHSGAGQRAQIITQFFSDPSARVRNAAARAFHQLAPSRSAELFSSANDACTPESRRQIAEAIVDSGLAAEAINDLKSGDRALAYNALCLLSLMVRSDEVEPLVRAIQDEPNVAIRGAIVKLLTSNGRSDVASRAVKRRLQI